MTTPTWASMVTVGRVVRPHGNRGWVVVNPETDFGDERFAAGATVYCEREGRVTAMSVSESRAYDHRWAVRFDALATIDEAETLRDLELRIPPEAVRPLGRGGYYEYDLIGCVVETTSGRVVGQVTRVQSGAGVPLLVVGPEADGVLIPLAADICVGVDVEARRIVVAPPPGLIDLNRAAGTER